MIKLYVTDICETCRVVLDIFNNLGLTCEIVNTSSNMSDDELDEMLDYNIKNYQEKL